MTTTPTREPDLDTAAEAAAEMLAHLGIVGDTKTPTRLVKALAELTEGVHVDPGRHLAVTFPPANPQPGLVSVQQVPFASVCAHHLLPYYGHATLAYLPQPGQPIVGLSKLPRLIREYAARPQVQEQMAADILTALVERLPCQGAAIAIRAVHTCMALRGTATGTDATMVTIDYRGELGDWRHEFRTLAAQLAG